MEKEIFKKRIDECFEEVVKELRYQIDYNIEQGIANYCEGDYGDVKSVLYGIMDYSKNFVGKPSLPSNIKRFNQIKKRVKIRFWHS